MRRWYREGPDGRLPRDTAECLNIRGEGGAWSEERVFAHDVQGFLNRDMGIRRIPLNNVVRPQFTVETLEDYGDLVLIRNEDGILGRENRDRSSSPNFLNHRQRLSEMIHVAARG